MKTKYLPLAGLFIIGILGASGSTAAAPINNSISSAHIAEIALPAEINAIQPKTIDTIIDQRAIAGAIYNESLIASENIIDDEIQADLIDAEREFAA